jgi:hypothetical protein
MSNHVQASDRSFSLYLSLKKLTQQFEELQELRARVRRAEARLAASRYKRIPRGVRHNRAPAQRLPMP